MVDDDRAGESKELVSNSPDQRNWRGILIAVLVIIIVFALIIVAVILVTPKSDDTEIGAPFVLEEVYSNDYTPREFQAKWIKDKNIFVYISKEKEVMQHDAENNRTSIIMSNSILRKYNTDMYFVSEDLDFVLIAYDVERKYRHSFVAKYKIFDRKSNNGKGQLVDFPEKHKTVRWDDRKLQFAGWSPTGSSLTFVYDNNLYYQETPYSSYYMITEDGRHNQIYNGISDWLYEEEILHSNIAHWVSPSVKHICFAKIDDTHVPKYRFPNYGMTTNIYGDIDELAYPKAGVGGANVNPTIQLFVASTSSGVNGQRQLRPPSEFKDSEFYVTQVSWRDDNHVLVAWSNRAQNKSILTICDIGSEDCYQSWAEVSHEGRGWVEITPPIFLKSESAYLTILPEQDAHHGYWKHIAKVTAIMRNNNDRTFVTHGVWDVLELVAVDQAAGIVYFLGNGGDPKDRHLYSVKIPESSSRLHEPQCMTCDLGEDCQYVSAQFSSSAQYYILNCKGPAIPTFTLRNTLDDRVTVLDDNADIKAKLDSKALPRIKYYDIQSPEGHTITAKVLIPQVMKKDQVILYPLLVHTYGAPGTQRVTKQFRIGWETYMVSQEKVIYAAIDGRGSPGRGDRYLHSIYRNLGTLEVEDQITGGRFLRDNFSFVDKERMAIWGWSYGGFVTAHALGDPSSIYPCGVAVAPVTDWRYYDTAYSERFMGFAHSNDNYRGYDNASVSRKAKYYKDKKFLLVHGTADDNVHFQHSAHFMKALVQEGVDFKIQVYPDEKHSLSGPNVTEHLYRTIADFLKHTCWSGGKPRIREGQTQ